MAENTIKKQPNFTPVSIEKRQSYVTNRESETYWQDAMRRLKGNKVAMLSMAIILIVLIMAIVGPLISKFDYSTNDLLNSNKWPDKIHWFGTDELGRDIFVRVMYGARISLSVGVVAAIINLTIGVLYGGISGYYGGNVDNIMMRIVDVLYSIPMMLYVILLMVVLGKSLLNVFITLGIIYWVGMARIVRGQVLSLKEQEFILAAKAAGASKLRIILRHLIPKFNGCNNSYFNTLYTSSNFHRSFFKFHWSRGCGSNVKLGNTVQRCTSNI